jgi:hypothetical protein
VTTVARGNTERNAGLLEARLAGATWAELGRRHDMTPQRVKQIVKREAADRGVRLPAVGAPTAPMGVHKVELSWIEVLVETEKALTAATDAKRDVPAYLPIPDDGQDRSDMWRWVVSVLEERGWRTGVDNKGDLVFYAPGPLTPPSDLQRQSN